jgi:hypothetical protein
MERNVWARAWRDLAALAILAICVVAIHGHGLTLGFWLDDNNHLELCKQNGFAGLVQGNRFDWTGGRLVHVWWAQKECGWAYFRPLTIALRTTQLWLFGLNPLPFHVWHLAVYTIVVLLLYGLVRRCGLGVYAALVAGLFFTLNPTHAFTASWLANDGTVLVGLWTVLGVWLMHASARAAHRRPVLLAGVMLCYLLALLSRENGIMLGPMLVVFDAVWAWSKPRGESSNPGVRRLTPGLETESTSNPWRRRLVFYGALAIAGLVYLPVRSWCLGAVPLPRSPYVHWPTEPGFASWLAYKVLNDSLGLALGSPFPVAAVSWLQARPWATLAGVVLALLLVAVFLFPLRRSRAMWGLLVGMALAAGPTITLFMTAYNYYVVSAGWAVLLALWARRLWPRHPRLVGGTLLAFASLYLFGQWCDAWVLGSGARTEHYVCADVLANDPANYPKRAQLFFINLPVSAAEVGPAIRLATDRTDLNFYPLTFAQEPFAQFGRFLIEQEDERTLLVQSLGKSWFSGPLGEDFQLGWFGASADLLHEGPVAQSPVAGPMPFRVEIVQADAHGVSALRFVFDRPLDDPHYRFFVGSSRGCARRLRFDGPELDEPDPALDKDMSRLRRMQIAFDRLTNLLAH